jgi:hypothetical protein
MGQDRTLVVVLCMHRCGSSFVTNLLERLGMSLGPFDRLAPSQSNKHGHFEAVPLTALNDELQAKFLGFTGEGPGPAEVFHRFRQTEGRWPAEPPIPEELLRRGRDLVEQLLASGPIVGFKDPRTVLTWPFWRRVLGEMPGLNVVPVMLVRSPHEIATSLFLRSQGDVSYRQALELVEVHFKRMQAIRAEFGGDVPLVCFDPRTLMDEARRAVQRCGLRWDEAVFRQVYDPDCRHHEASAVLHPAQQAFDELCGPGGTADPEGCPAAPDPWQMLEAAAAREDFFQERVISLQQQLTELRRESSRQIRQLLVEIASAKHDLAVLGGELALMKGSRTWRLRESLLAAACRAGLVSLRR